MNREDMDPDWLEKLSPTYTHASPIVVGTVTESRPGAAIKVERVLLSAQGMAMLQAGAKDKQ